MLVPLLLALSGTPTPSPSPSPGPLPVIASVRVATGSAQSLHALPVAASALDRTAIGTSSALSADALLRRLPGFDRTRSNALFTNYGQLRVSFAGAGNDRGLVLVDGIPAQDGFGGQIDWAAYPASDLESAELLLGAGSALYGSGAVGGVLDLHTFGPADGPRPLGTLYVGAGSNAYDEAWFHLRQELSSKVSASVAVQHERLQYFALAPSYRSVNSGISQAGASMAALRVRYEAGKRDVLEAGLRGAWDDQDEGRPNYTFSRRLAQTDLRFTHTTPGSALQTTLYERTAYIVNLADQFPAKPGVLRYVQDVPTNESGASVRWTVGGGISTFQFRADARHTGGQTLQYGPSGALQNADGGIQNSGGLALQQSWHLARFEAVTGARFDLVREPSGRSDQAVSPRAALRYDLSRSLAVRLSAGSGLRAPFLNELLRGYFIGNVRFEPNPSLVPERSRTLSAGLDWATPSSHLSFDLFSTGVNDAIMFRTIDPTHQIRSNVDRTHTRAYVLSYTHAFAGCSRLSAWFSRQDARVVSGPGAIAGKQLQYVPEESASLDYSARIGHVAAGVSVSYVGQTFADDLNTQPLGTAVVAGARLGVPLPGGAVLDLRAANITDARYLSSIDRYAPPSLLSIGVEMPVGREAPAANACLP